MIEWLVYFWLGVLVPSKMRAFLWRPLRDRSTSRYSKPSQSDFLMIDGFVPEAGTEPFRLYKIIYISKLSHSLYS